jgi:DNA-binding beta-propeller fold protein YncE
MRARALILVVLSATTVASCTSQRAPGPNDADRSVPNETLLLGTAGGPLAVDVPSGDVVVDARGAIASADGARIFTAEPDAGRTVVSAFDAATGESVARTSVAGELSIRVVSATGRQAALMEPLSPGQDAWTPVPRPRTTIVVADPSGQADPMRFRLRGNYEPEAFSTDGSRLFLIQYLPAMTPAVYRVTVLDLYDGRVQPVFGPYKAPAERMPGTRLEQVPAVDGTKLFTLYTSDRPGFAPHDAPVPANAVVSFVHVLSLEDGWAHCVGLPKQLWHQPGSAEAMAVSPDGSTLYVVDADKGLVVTMDTDSLDVSRPHHVELPDPGSRTTATVSADGGTLFVGTAGGDGAVTAIDTTSLTATRSWATGAGVSGLGLSLDGARLYVALTDRLEVLSAASGRDLGAVSVPSPAPIQAISAIAA